MLSSNNFLPFSQTSPWATTLSFTHDPDRPLNPPYRHHSNTYKQQQSSLHNLCRPQPPTQGQQVQVHVQPKKSQPPFKFQQQRQQQKSQPPPPPPPQHYHQKHPQYPPIQQERYHPKSSMNASFHSVPRNRQALPNSSSQRKTARADRLATQPTHTQQQPHHPPLPEHLNSHPNPPSHPLVRRERAPLNIWCDCISSRIADHSIDDPFPSRNVTFAPIYSSKNVHPPTSPSTHTLHTSTK